MTQTAEIYLYATLRKIDVITTSFMSSLARDEILSIIRYTFLYLG